jgi:recombination protein RecA
MMPEEKDLKKKLHLIDLSQRMDEMIACRIPTGILAFDRVIGGGIPAGRLTELYGDFSSGKSRIAYHVLAETQRLGGTAVLIDTERAFGRGLSELAGLDPRMLIYPDPAKIDTIEEVFSTIKIAIELFKQEKSKDSLMTIVWDSVAATPGLEDLEKEIGRNEASMRRAKVISDGLKQMMGEVYRGRIATIFVNQIRDNIGVLYGEKVSTVGGKALKFSASLRLHVHLAGKLKNEQTCELDGYKGRLVVEKSRVSKPFGVVNFDMRTDLPIDKYAGLLDYLCRHLEVEDEGRGWYKFPGDKKNFREAEFPAIYEARQKKEI